METNESILVRDVVGLDDRRVIGKMRELRVNCDDLAVSHYVVTNAATSSPLVLPFDCVLAIGDTFATIQSREDFLSASSADAQELLSDGFKLIGVDAFSRTGDRLGVVAGYDFDPVFGTVTALTLDTGDTFENTQFVFFAPEFVFVDTGALTLGERREVETAAAADVAAEAEAVAEAEVIAEDAAADEVEDLFAAADDVAVEVEDTEIVVEDDEDETEEADDAIEVVEEILAEDAEVATEDEVAAEIEEEVAGLSEEDIQLVEILVGTTLSNDVTSEDGAFVATKGTVLTRELVDDAVAHDALLLLTLAADL